MSGAKMCKEKAAISQLEALGWVWVDDARWEVPKPRDPKLRIEAFELYKMVLKNEAWRAEIEAAGDSAKTGGSTSKIYAKVQAAWNHFPEMGYEYIDGIWYKKEPDKPVHLPGIGEWGIGINFP